MRKLKTKHLDYWVDTVLDYGWQGMGLTSMLHHLRIRKSVWTAYVNKHRKVLGSAIEDGGEFARGDLINKMDELMHSNGLNQTVAKLYIEQVTGWGKDSVSADQISPIVNIIISPTDAAFVEARKEEREALEKADRP